MREDNVKSVRTGGPKVTVNGCLWSLGNRIQGAGLCPSVVRETTCSSTLLSFPTFLSLPLLFFLSSFLFSQFSFLSYSLLLCPFVSLLAFSPFCFLSFTLPPCVLPLLFYFLFSGFLSYHFLIFILSFLSCDLSSPYLHFLSLCLTSHFLVPFICCCLFSFLPLFSCILSCHLISSPFLFYHFITFNSFPFRFLFYPFLS